MNTDQTTKLKAAIDADLRLKNYRVNARKGDALTQWFITNQNLLSFAEDGAISFNGNDLPTALGKMLSMQDARDYFGVIAAPVPLTPLNPFNSTGFSK